ncbi:MAG: S8 family serine peptidase [Micromonosporaceae bacterium]
MEPPPPGPPWGPPRGESPWPHRIATAYVGIAGLLISAVAALGQLGTWFFDQAALIQDTPAPSWPLVGWISAVIVGALALPMLFFPRRWAGLRAAGRVWIVGALLFGALGTLRALPLEPHELYLGTLTLSAGGIALVVWLVSRHHARRTRYSHDAGHDTDGTHDPDGGSPRRGGAIWLGAAAGLASLLPWAAWGALGGVLETALTAAAATALGVLTGAVLGRGFWTAYHELARWQLVLGGGYVAGVAIALLAAGTGGPGVQLLALLTLPPLGYAAAALQRGRPSGVPVGVMVGIAAFGPLGFADPEEFSVLIGEVLRWLSLTALVALGIALLAAALYGFLLRRRQLHTGVAALVTVVVGIAGIGVYAATGQPGFHGERLFVVMAAQANLSGVDTGGDRARRIGEVYRRLVAHADRTQKGLRRELDRRGIAYTPYYLVNGISVRVGPALREWLAGRDDVDRVLLDPVLRPVPAPAAAMQATRQNPPGVPQWNLALVNAPQAWKELEATGEGIVVGSSDSGVDGAHPALRSGFRGGADSWYDPWNHTRTPTDLGGHGTHTVGSAVGRDNVGVAPGAQWIGCVNLARNMGNVSYYLDCLQFMLAPFEPGEDPFTDGDPARAPHVLNNSWGCPELEGCDAESLRPAIGALRTAGIFFVAAAGNTGPGCDTVTDPPAAYADAFSVAAVGEARHVAEFSSRGGAETIGPDVAAPGEEVLSAVPGGGYARSSGTSMAAPHVAGVVALLWSAVPELVGDIEATEELLTDTARPVSGEDPCGGNATAGAGIVDAYAAIRAARQ